MFRCQVYQKNAAVVLINENIQDIVISAPLYCLWKKADDKAADFSASICIRRQWEYCSRTFTRHIWHEMVQHENQWKKFTPDKKKCKKCKKCKNLHQVKNAFISNSISHAISRVERVETKGTKDLPLPPAPPPQWQGFPAARTKKGMIVYYYKIYTLW